MTAFILAAAAGWVGWLGYLVGQRVAERRAAAHLDRMRYRLNHPWPPSSLHRIDR